MAGTITAGALASGLAAEHAALARRLRERGRPEEDIARRTGALSRVQAAEAALYGYPGLARELRGSEPGSRAAVHARDGPQAPGRPDAQAPARGRA